MSRDIILKDDEGVRYSYSNLKTQGWLNGHSSGLDKSVEWLLERAATLFRERKHEEAVKLQRLADDMAKELRGPMELRAKEHEREFPVIVPDNDE
jgi:hypothetical protein